MNNDTSLHLLQAMIDYFEAGNKESDGAAKNIIESDADGLGYWQEHMENFRQTGQWTGLRAPEAEVIAAVLRQVRARLAGLSGLQAGRK